MSETDVRHSARSDVRHDQASTPIAAVGKYALPCAVCDKKLMNARNLYWHLRLVHEQVHAEADVEVKSALDAWKVSKYGSDARLSSAAAGAGPDAPSDAVAGLL